MKQFFTKFTALCMLFAATTLQAQQLPDPHFEDWSDSFNGDAQPKYWHGSNVEQVGFKFTFLYQKDGRSGKCAYVADKEVGALGITEIGPGYFGLGTSWQKLEGLNTGTATAGTYGGISFKYRPDSMVVWIKRTGDNTGSEDFHLLFYSWTGTAKGTAYKNKNNKCTDVSMTDEESDVRITMDGNECTTSSESTAKQVAEGWYRARAKYTNWTRMSVPIYYMSDDAPTKCNVIFSAGNYPNFRANSGLYKDNGLWVDDVELIYSNKIQRLYIDNVLWGSFNPNSSEEQVYSLGDDATSVPSNIVAMRGAGTLTNTKNKTANFPGRRLGSDELTIKKGGLGEVTTLTVKDINGNSRVYKIKFVKEASKNSKLSAINLDGIAMSSFNANTFDYTVTLPYDTAAVPAVPVVTYEKGDAGQTVEITQASGINGTATIKVTAANKDYKSTYTVTFKMANLDDNTLKDILIDGVSLPGFIPSQLTYRVSMPLDAEQVPEVTAVSAYDKGTQHQTIKYTKPADLSGKYLIDVTTPGNPVPKTYTLSFKKEASTYCKLKELHMIAPVNPLSTVQRDSDYIYNFSPDNVNYFVYLPLGTSQLPEITYEKGDKYQEVVIEYGGLNGESSVVVTAASGAKMVYRIHVTTMLSDYSYLESLTIDGEGELTPAFAPNVFKYTYVVNDREAGLPNISWVPGDQFQTVEMVKGGLNETTRINVTAGDGSTSTYQILFTVPKSNIDYLNGIFLNGQLIAGWDKDQLEYTVVLEKTDAFPVVTFERGETAKDPSGEYIQIVNERKITAAPGEYKFTVIAENGSKRTYVIKFKLNLSSDATLQTIKVAGVPLSDFDPSKTEYEVILPPGSSMPKVEVEKRAGQTVVPAKNNGVYTFTVTAEDKETTLVYTVTVTIQKSDNAYLKMIRLVKAPGDTIDLPGFVRNQLDYTYVFDSESAPAIIADKENEAQQVSISSPLGAGVAQIIVAPDASSDETNQYRITFKSSSSVALTLKSIYADGEEITGWDPDVNDYTVTYSGSLPVITYEQLEGQKVSQLEAKDKVTLMVEYAGESNTYTVKFKEVKSGNALLSGILLDGVLVDGWDAHTYHYSKTLEAGEVEPVITWQKAEEEQTVVFGQKDAGEYQIVVLAADGQTQQVYTVSIQNKKFADATLAHIYKDGVEITDQFVNGVCDGGMVSDGQILPTITYEKKDGQNVVLSDVSATQQRILVVAESGAEQVYIINYTLTNGDDVQLSGILVDGVAIKGFDPAVSTYTVKLDERTAQVPAITPQSNIIGQTYIITYGRVNARTSIEVISKDKSTTGHYYIDFEVRPLTNTALKRLRVYSSAEDEDLDVNQLEHTFVYDPTAGVPQVLYEAAEPEQRIEYTRKSGGDTEIKVIAQSGQSQTYKVHFTTTRPTVANVLKSLKVNNVDMDLTAGDVFDVTLPYGTATLPVVYEKNFQEQAVIVYNGGVNKPTTIVVSANHPDVADKVYTINPTVERYSMTGKLTDLQFKGATVPNFQPDVYNYVVNVTAQPAAGDFVGTAFGGATVTKSGIDAKNKKITLTVASGKVYTVSWFYENDDPQFDFSKPWVQAAKGPGYKPSSVWKVPADCADKLNYDIDFLIHVNLMYQTGKEVIKAGVNGVMLSTLRGAPMNGSVPGMMTTGNMALTLKTSGESTSSMSIDKNTGVQFRNTPEQITMDYTPLSTTNVTNWYYDVLLTDGTNTKTTHHSGTYDGLNTLQHATETLDYSGLGNVSRMSFAINSAHTSNIKDMSSGAFGKIIMESQMLVENIHFVYNSVITSAKINGKNATVNNTNKTISITLDQEETAYPILEVVGQVSDQEQVVEWGEEKLVGNNMVRTGTLRNYGEDHSYTDYTLTTTRPAVTDATLKSVTWGGTEVVFSGNACVKEKTAPFMPISDVVITPNSVHQNVAVAHRNDSVIITVTPEKGDAQTYVICHKVSINSNANISVTTDGTLTPAWNPEVTEYSVSTMPANFTIQNELFQNVKMMYTEDTTRFVVMASDKLTTKTYTVAREEASVEPNLVNVKLDGTTKTLSPSAPAEVELMPDVVTFDRQSALAKVTETITIDSIILAVEGTSKTNTYKIVAKNEADKNAYLAGVLIGGKEYEEFDYEKMNNTIPVDSMVDLKFLAANQAQTLEISVSTKPNPSTSARPIRRSAVAQPGIVFSVKVTPKVGDPNIYTFALEAPKSSDATLKGIVVGNDTIKEFYADKTNYEYVLPVAMPKVNQPEIPAIKYLTSDPQATVEVEPHVLEEASEIQVHSADGTETKFYNLTLVPQKSTYAELDGILVDGVLVPGFAADRYFYSVQIEPATTHVVEVSSPDKFIDTTIVYSENTVIINVTAEDGIHSQRYFVELYEVQKSNNATLSNLLVADATHAMKPIENFDPMNNVYNIELPNNVANLPDVQAVPMVNGQTITPRKDGWKVLVDVVAPNNETKNTYTINFIRPLSDNTDLEMIQLDGRDIEGFDPKTYVYLQNLPIGQEVVPEVFAISAESLQDQKEPVVVVDNARLRAEVINFAQNGDSVVYTIVFNKTYSAADTLLDIRYNNKSIEGFEPKKFDYTVPVPAGQNLPTLEDVSVEKADEFQVVYTTKVSSDERTCLYRIEVIAHNGHKNVYTVSFEKELLNIAKLDMIKINGKPLEAFKADQYEYSVELAAGTTDLPVVTYDYEDSYHQLVVKETQADTIVGKSLNDKVVITVTAENGRDFKIYTIHFPVALSKDATLSGIIYGRDNPVPNFNPMVNEYTIELPLGTTNVPQITYIKKYSQQNVNQSYDSENDWRVYVDVTAEDTTVTSRYTLDFVLEKSQNTHLKDITFEDSTIVIKFNPDSVDYRFEVPYSADRDTSAQIVVVPVPAENGQVVDVTYARYGELFSVKIDVTAPDEETHNTYSLIYSYRKNPDASLKALALGGKALENFKSDTLEYFIEFPVGTDSTQYYTPEKVEYELSDPMAKVNVKMDQSFTLYIVVTAQDTTSTRTYVLHQTTIKSDDNYLAKLFIDGVEYRDFDPEVLDYVYYVPAGVDAAPLVEAVARDSFAMISIMPNGIDSLTIITCVAQNGKKRTYTILFTNSDIDDNATPQPRDVLVKRLFGTNKILIASLRKKVSFGLFDQAGRMVHYIETVEPANPNDVIIAVDGNGQEVLTDVVSEASGTVVELNTNQIYFYTFFEAGKTKITSGKLIIMN